MPVKTIQFNKNSGPLKAEFVFEGQIAASYGFTLWETNSNAEVEFHKGNNQNSDDDTYSLPNPVEKNDGRIIDLSSAIRGLSAEQRPYKVKINVYQDNNLLGGEEETGQIASETKMSQLYVKLIKS